MPLVVRLPDQAGNWNNGIATLQEGSVNAGEHIKLIFLQRPEPAGQDWTIEGRKPEVFFGVKAGTEKQKSAGISPLYVFKSNHGRATLQMHRHRRGGVTEIKAIVGKTEMKIPWTANQEAVTVFESIFRLVLIAEAAAMVKIAFKNISGSGAERIERNGLFVACWCPPPGCNYFAPTRSKR